MFQAHTVKHCPYNPEQLRRQTELAEIWRSYRETKDMERPEDHQHLQSRYNGGLSESLFRYSSGHHRTQPLSSSSLYNTHANRHNQRQPLSSSFNSMSISPSSSCTSPLLSPNASLLTSFPSSPSSPDRSNIHHTPSQAISPRNNKYNHPDENSILMENLYKLLQFSN